MKGIYLFANRARHENHDIIYNDVEKNITATSQRTL